MIRDKKRKLNSSRSFPLLWSECECCKKEIRLEFVWKFFINDPSIMHYTTHLVCRRCAETRADADEFALLFIKKINRPKPPAMPPGDD